MSDKPRERSFLERWSERKRQVETDLSSPVPDHGVSESGSPGNSAIDSMVSSPIPAPVSFSTPADLPVSVLSETDVAAGDSTQEVKRSELEPAEESSAQAQSLILTDDDMPAIESLSSQSDLSGFFNKGVSAALRKAALRHVFQQPQYNVRDGLNDYDGDYTVFEPLGDTVTSDMKWHIARKERNRLEAEARELEEQERLLAEQQALDDEQLASEAAEEEPCENDEDVANAEQNINIVDGDEQRVSDTAALPDCNDDLLLTSADITMDEKRMNEKGVERVAGKLRRTGIEPLNRDNETLQIAEDGSQKNANAREKQE